MLKMEKPCDIMDYVPKWRKPCNWRMHQGIIDVRYWYANLCKWTVY